MEKETNSLSQEDRLSIKVDEILASITSLSNQDAEEIESLKAIIKKKVPFLKRNTFTALLLKLYADKKVMPVKEERKKVNKELPRKEVPNKRLDEAKKEKAERPLPEGAKTLYLNIGKMKHLYGKDLAKLLQSELAIGKEDIYSLRVHDKYSFITMSEANCNKAIEALNGKEINGRVAQINFSTPKARA